LQTPEHILRVMSKKDDDGRTKTDREVFNEPPF
jgi:hypothetical protein